MSVRHSLFDPLVIAAIVGLLGGGVTLTITSEDAQDRHRAELAAQQQKATCDRAFAFLQDEAINPRLEKDDAFYQSQRRIAERCSIERKTP